MKNFFEKNNQRGENLVFENEIHLKSSYVPDKLLFRDEEINQIYSNFNKHFNGKISRHMLIHGPPGVGKTHAILKVRNDFNGYANKKGFKAEIRYFSCEKKTYYQLITNVAKTFNPGFPQRGYGESEVQDKILGYIKNSEKKYILMFDEVDKMNRSRSSDTIPLQDIVYFITRANEIANKSSDQIDITGVLVGNKQGIDKEVAACSAATASAFHPKEVFFRDYNADELVEIIKRRCRNAFKEGVIDSGAIRYLAAQITKHTHDLRFGFEVLKEAGDQLEAGSSGSIDEDMIKIVIEEVESADLEKMVREMNNSKLLTLWSIIQGDEELPNDAKIDGGLSSKEFYEVYMRCCEMVKMEERSQVHITQNVASSLATQGFISTKIRGLGRGKGRTILFYLGEVDGLKEAVRNVVNDRFHKVPTVKYKKKQTSLLQN